MNVLIIFAVLQIFCWYDFIVRSCLIFDSKNWLAVSSRCMDRVVYLIVALLRTYRNFHIRLDRRLNGRQLPDRFMIVSNHQSMLDIAILLYVFRGKGIRFVAKRELGKGIPFLSLILREQGHCLIARRVDPAQAFHSLDRFAKRCRLTGADPVIFPEGTRARDGEVKAFHAGGIRRIMAEEPLPIVVIALDGGWRAATLKTIRKNLNGLTYNVRIIDVLDPPKDKQEVGAAAARSEELIRAAIKDMRGRGAE